MTSSEKIKALGFLEGMENELYFRQVSKQSIVFVEWVEYRWIAWRERFDESKSVHIKTIAVTGNFDEIIKKTKRYLNYFERNVK